MKAAPNAQTPRAIAGKRSGNDNPLINSGRANSHSANAAASNMAANVNHIGSLRNSDIIVSSPRLSPVT